MAEGLVLVMTRRFATGVVGAIGIGLEIDFVLIVSDVKLRIGR